MSSVEYRRRLNSIERREPGLRKFTDSSSIFKQLCVLCRYGGHAHAVNVPRMRSGAVYHRKTFVVHNRGGHFPLLPVRLTQRRHTVRQGQINQSVQTRPCRVNSQQESGRSPSVSLRARSLARGPNSAFAQPRTSSDLHSKLA